MSIASSSSSSSLRIPSLRPIPENCTYYPTTTTTTTTTTAVTTTPNTTTPNTTNTTTGTNTSSSSCCCLCHICHVQRSQYTCPRCRILYCSVICYRKHGDDCREHFYEQRVTQILQLEIKEQSSHFRQQIIMTTMQQQQQCPTETINPPTTTTTTTPLLSREELVQVWSLLERIEENEAQNNNDNNHHHHDTDPVTILQNALPQHLSLHVPTVLRHALQQLTTTIPIHFSSSDDNGNNNDETTTINSAQPNTTTINNNNNTNSVAEWILEPWYPWWCPNYIVRNGNQNDDDSTETNDTVLEYANDPKSGTMTSRNSDTTITTTIEREVNATTTTTTLDEKLWSLPRFSTLYSMKKSHGKVHGNDHSHALVASSPPPQQAFPLLQFNLMEILLATVYTLRTYHGVENIVGSDNDDNDDDVTILLEAATTLVNASLVLRHDQRYTNLESVLMDIGQVHHPIQQQIHYDHHHHHFPAPGQGPGTMTLELLLHDVARLYTNHRLVARALLEASEIVQAALAAMKRSSSSSRSKMHPLPPSERDDNIEEMRPMLRRIHKKIIFYASWTMAVSNISTSTVKRGWPYRHLSTDMKVWMDGWQLLSPSQGNQAALSSSIQITV